MRILIILVVSLLIVSCEGTPAPTPVQQSQPQQTIPKAKYNVNLSTQQMFWAESKIKNFLAQRGCSDAISQLEAYGSYSRDAQTGILKVGMWDSPTRFELFWLVHPTTGAVSYYDYPLC